MNATDQYPPSRSVSARRFRPSPLEDFLRDVSATHVPFAPAAEQAELAVRARAGDAGARGRLMRMNIPLVIFLAKRFRGRGLPIQDLIQEGMVGLDRGIGRFDPRAGASLATYAAGWIKQAMTAAVRDKSREIRRPAYTEALMNRWREERGRLAGESGARPADAEVSAAMGLKPARARIVAACLASERFAAVDDLVPARPSPDPAEAMDRLALAERLAAALAALDGDDPPAARAVRLRHGLGGEGPMMPREVGERMGVTREWARKLEIRGMARLRRLMGRGDE